jgi:hypothetical protein
VSAKGKGGPGSAIRGLDLIADAMRDEVDQLVHGLNVSALPPHIRAGFEDLYDSINEFEQEHRAEAGRLDRGLAHLESLMHRQREGNER